MNYLKMFAAVGAMLGALTMVGCSDDDKSTGPQLSNARVLVVHASPDAPGVDILVDNAKVNIQPLTFPNNTGYLNAPAGNRNIKVNAAGTPTSVLNTNLDLAAGVSYSVFAIDTLASIELLVLQDDLGTPASGKSHVRFVHLAPNAPAVDITLTDGTVLFGNKAFGQYTPFTPLTAGTYDLQVRLAGSPTVVLNLPNIVLENGKIYTIFAKGLVGGSGAQALGAQIIVNN